MQGGFVSKNEGNIHYWYPSSLHNDPLANTMAQMHGGLSKVIFNFLAQTWYYYLKGDGAFPLSNSTVFDAG